MRRRGRRAEPDVAAGPMPRRDWRVALWPVMTRARPVRTRTARPRCRPAHRGGPAVGGRRRDSGGGDRGPGWRHLRQRVMATWPGPGSAGTLAYVLLAVGGASLLARRRYPVGVLAVTLATTLWASEGKRARDLSRADRGVLQRGAGEEAGRRDRLADHRLRRIRVALADRPAWPPLCRVRARAGGGADLLAGRRRADPQPEPARRRAGSGAGKKSSAGGPARSA